MFELSNLEIVELSNLEMQLRISQKCVNLKKSVYVYDK